MTTWGDGPYPASTDLPPITVTRRDIIHGREHSAVRNSACRAVRRQVPGARLVVAGRTRLSYVLLDGWRLTAHVVIPLPPGAPEPPPPRFKGWGTALLLYGVCAALGSCLELLGVLR